MKRKIWNQKSVPSTKSTGLWVRIQPKTGSITFSRDLGEKLKLDKTNINFVQDEDRPADWYIELSGEPDAFKVKTKKQPDGVSDKQYIIQSTFLAREIVKSAGLEQTSQRFMVAAEPVEKNLYAIITKSGQSQLKKAS